MPAKPTTARRGANTFQALTLSFDSKFCSWLRTPADAWMPVALDLQLSWNGTQWRWAIRPIFLAVISRFTIEIFQSIYLPWRKSTYPSPPGLLKLCISRMTNSNVVFFSFFGTNWWLPVSRFSLVTEQVTAASEWKVETVVRNRQEI